MMTCDHVAASQLLTSCHQYYTLNLNSTAFRSRITLESALSVGGNVPTQCLGKRRQMRLDDIADHVDLDAEVLVRQSIAEPSNLRPGDLRVRASAMRCDGGGRRRERPWPLRSNCWLDVAFNVADAEMVTKNAALELGPPG